MAGLTFLLLITMWATNHYVYLDEFRKYEVDYNVLVTNKIKSQFDFATDIIRSTGNALGSNAKVVELLTNPQSGSEQEIAARRNEISSLLLGVIGTQSYIKGAHIVSVRGQVYSSMLSTDEYQIYEFASGYFDTLREKKVKELWATAHKVEYYPPDNYFNVMSYICPVYNIEKQKLVGLIVLDIDYEVIRNMFTLSTIELDEKVMVVDSEGNIIFNHPIISNFEPVLQQYPQILTAKNLQLRGTVFGRDTIIVTETIEMADWKIVRMIEALPITARSRTLLSTFNSILFLTALISLSFILLTTQSLTKPVKTLIQACKRIEKGDLDFRVSLNLKNELGILGDTFNIMMDQIQNYYQKEFEEQKRKSELEFQVLQAQINPHFLYNTLDSIKWLAVLQNMNNIADMCTSLINLLKYNLAQPGTLTTLNDEVENLKNYIRIQKFRYGDTFEFSTQLDPETSDCEMLRFVLQPLVENCILHAFEDIEDKGFIKVLSFIDNDKLHIEVIDNGSGMDLSTVYTLNQNDSSKGKRFNTIGIHNIKERIRLQYGEGYGLYYISEPGIGTIAEMVLPVIKKKGQMKSLPE